MTIDELKQKNVIHFEKINQALGTYANVTLPMDAKKAMKHFQSLREEYGAGNSFADFYYFKLDEDAQEMIDEELTPAEASYVQGLAAWVEDAEKDLIFPLDDTLLRIICKLNAKEILFSTLYFAESSRPRTTWWGNYNKEYICFSDKKN